MSNTKSKEAKAKSFTNNNLDNHYLRNIVTVIIDLCLVSKYIEVYVMLSNTVYPLSKSTVFDIYKAMYLVNNKQLLELRSFKPAQFNKVVEYKSS